MQPGDRVRVKGMKSQKTLKYNDTKGRLDMLRNDGRWLVDLDVEEEEQK